MFFFIVKCLNSKKWLLKILLKNIVTVNNTVIKASSWGKNDEKISAAAMHWFISQVSLSIQKYDGFFRVATRVLVQIMTFKS
jgi:hypothetical protein